MNVRVILVAPSAIHIGEPEVALAWGLEKGTNPTTQLIVLGSVNVPPGEYILTPAGGEK